MNNAFYMNALADTKLNQQSLSLERIKNEKDNIDKEN